MNIVLMGPPGSGKATQAKFIADELGIPHISTGDMLRSAIAADTPLGREAKALIDDGKFASDAVVLDLVRERTMDDDCADGFILDGFPRKIPQALALDDAGISIDLVLEFSVPELELTRRLSGRLTHEGSGRAYHADFNPPKVDGRDDVTGEALIQRPDDRWDAVRERLATYRHQTAPLRTFYQELAAKTSLRHVILDGVGEVAVVREAVLGELIERGIGQDKSTVNQRINSVDTRRDRGLGR